MGTRLLRELDTQGKLTMVEEIATITTEDLGLDLGDLDNHFIIFLTISGECD